MIPTLYQVLELAKEAPEMLFNIEMKGPNSEEILAQYDVDKACSIVKYAISKFELGSRTIVSSF